MNTLISIVVKKPATLVKGTTFSAKCLKTQTNLELNFEKKDRASIDFPLALSEDIAALKLEDGPITSITLIVEGATAIGRLHNRTVRSFSRIGVVTEEIPWDADGGVLEYKLEDGVGADLPAIIDVLTRMVFRACTKFTATQHPLSLYDLKQATGLVSDAKEELGEAGATLKWFNVRELAILEEAKQRKAEEKAKTKAAKAEEKAAKAAAAKVLKQSEAKAKKAAKGKAGKVAPLIPETDEGDEVPNE